MILFDPYVIEAAKQHAVEAFPHESVGFVVSGRYEPQRNDSDSYDLFSVAAAAYIDASRRGLQAVIHSHPGGPPSPSRLDMQQQLATAVPWGIVVTYGDGADDPVWWGEGVPRPPLIGRRFIHGINDCYSLIRDFYREHLRIELPEIPRDNEWWAQGLNMYLDLYEEVGFIPIKEPAVGDMVLMSTNRATGTVNHGGIYLGDQILHHLSNRLSRREPIYPWRTYVHGYYRHRDFTATPDLSRIP